MRAIQVAEFGGPEMMRLVELPTPEPSDGSVLIEVTAAGINFADTHTRVDHYHVSAPLPYVPGIEIAGTRVDTGERVLAMIGHGGYAEYAVAPTAATFPVPAGIDDARALALFIQGVTAYHLLHTSARVCEGEAVVVHAAAGGVGSLAVQLAKLAGARVIATASTEQKRAQALALGADAAIDPDPQRLCRRIREANGGDKVDVVLEMAGGQTFIESLRALGRFGRLVAYGNASHEVVNISNVDIQRHSRSAIGFWLVDCLTEPGRLMAAPLATLFALVADRALEPLVGGTYAMADAERAHRDMEARRTTGKLVLDPTACST